MSHDPETSEADRHFERLAVRFVGDPAVSQGTGFGSIPGLRVGNKIFAMLARGELVVKLPLGRVDQLVDSGSATRFDPGHGRLMREWVAIPFERVADWDGLIEEAFSFVGRRSDAG